MPLSKKYIWVSSFAHLTFWVAYFFLEFTTVEPFIGVKLTLYRSAIFAPIHALTVYLHLYLLFPRYFRQSKWLPYLGFTLALLLLNTLMRVSIDQFFYQWEVSRELIDRATFRQATAPRIDSLMSTALNQHVIGLFASNILILFLSLPIRFIQYEVEVRTLTEEKHQQELAKARAMALKAQINPHTMSNIFNTLGSFISQGKQDEAESYLQKYAALTRIVLHRTDELLVPLDRELEALDLYLSLEQVRLSDHFEYELKIEPNLKVSQTLIPPQLLQPLLENAVGHGIYHKEEAGKISIRITKTGQQLLCEVEDDGVGREKAKQYQRSMPRRPSKGLSITRSRIENLNLLYAQPSRIVVKDLTDTSGEACGTLVQIFLPFLERVTNGQAHSSKTKQSQEIRI